MGYWIEHHPPLSYALCTIFDYHVFNKEENLGIMKVQRYWERCWFPNPYVVRPWLKDFVNYDKCHGISVYLREFNTTHPKLIIPDQSILIKNISLLGLQMEPINLQINRPTAMRKENFLETENKILNQIKDYIILFVRLVEVV